MTEDKELSAKEKESTEFVIRALDHIEFTHLERTFTPVNFIKEMAKRGCDKCKELVEEWDKIKAKKE